MRKTFSLSILMAGVLMSSSLLGIPSLRPDYRYYADNQSTDATTTTTSSSTISQDPIVRDIRQHIMNDHSLNINLISITNTDGKVVITGSVNSEKEKARVGDIVKNIKGVKNVDNKLQVNSM